MAGSNKSSANDIFSEVLNADEPNQLELTRTAEGRYGWRILLCFASRTPVAKAIDLDRELRQAFTMAGSLA